MYICDFKKSIKEVVGLKIKMFSVLKITVLAYTKNVISTFTFINQMPVQ